MMNRASTTLGDSVGNRARWNRVIYLKFSVQGRATQERIGWTIGVATHGAEHSPLIVLPAATMGSEGDWHLSVFVVLIADFLCMMMIEYANRASHPFNLHQS